MIRLLPAAALALLGGCSIPVHMPYSEVCMPDDAQAYVGQVYTPRIAEIVKDKTRSFHLRTLTPGMVVTQEFNAKRVNIAIDERNRVTRIYCG